MDWRHLSAAVGDVRGPGEKPPEPGKTAAGNIPAAPDEDWAKGQFYSTGRRGWRTGGTRGTLTATYRTVAGTAAANVNFRPVSGTLTFNEGEFEKIAETEIAAVRSKCSICSVEIYSRTY